MKFAVLKETQKSETRVAMTPEVVKRFVKLGVEIVVESEAGKTANISDEAFAEAGAQVTSDLVPILKDIDVVLKVSPPTLADLKKIPKGSKLFCLMNPYQNQKVVDACAKQQVEAFALELMPRISRAQSMDVLSSQSNLAGYRAVIEAANAYGRALPMMMTAAGTVAAAKVFVMGAGVAGLQAIATARRLGAVVTATDVRPAAKEQVASLGAEFIAVEDDEFKQAESSGGYAKEMSEAYKQKQRELLASHVTKQNIVITTALIPGRPAPKLLSEAMVNSMKPGSVIVDLAVEQGGNLEQGTAEGIHFTSNGVKIVGIPNMAGQLAADASSLFARNIFAFISPMIDSETKTLKIDDSDELITATRLTQGGAIVHPNLKEKEPELANDNNKEKAAS
jgi:H+-translocating NAD(P) transhydrogenase subunit alpha